MTDQLSKLQGEAAFSGEREAPGTPRSQRETIITELFSSFARVLWL
jgi:hypothetical protein